MLPRKAGKINILWPQLSGYFLGLIAFRPHLVTNLTPGIFSQNILAISSKPWASYSKFPQYTSRCFSPAHPNVLCFVCTSRPTDFYPSSTFHTCSSNKHSHSLSLPPLPLKSLVRQSAAFQRHIPGNVPTHQCTQLAQRPSLLCWVKVSNSPIHLRRSVPVPFADTANIQSPREGSRGPTQPCSHMNHEPQKINGPPEL